MDAQAKEIKNKVMCEINSFAIVYFFFDETLSLNNQAALNFNSTVVFHIASRTLS